MSDFTVPSYRIRPARSSFEVPWRPIGLAAGFVAVLGICGGATWWVMRGGSGSIPVVEADTRPIRVRPDTPGGMRVANQDERIFDARRPGQPATAPNGQRLAPDAERPDVTALRQAAQPRPGAPAAPGQPAAAPQAGTAAAPARPGAPAAPAAAPPPAAAPAVVAGPPAGSLVPLPSNPNAAPAAPPVVAAVAPPLPPAPVGRPVNPRIAVQLGAVGSEAAARAEWERLKIRVPQLAERQPAITRAERDGNAFWRLRTTGFPDNDAARALCDAARAKNVACTVIGA